LLRFVKFPFVQFEILKQFFIEFDLNEINFEVWNNIQGLIFYQESNQNSENLKHTSVLPLCLEEYNELLKVLFERFPNEPINSSFLNDKLNERENYQNKITKFRKKLHRKKKLKKQLNESILEVQNLQTIQKKKEKEIEELKKQKDERKREIQEEFNQFSQLIEQSKFNELKRRICELKRSSEERNQSEEQQIQLELQKMTIQSFPIFPSISRQ
jgi:DNA repair exonuclease SbcCD ATPase subunit